MPETDTSLATLIEIRAQQRVLEEALRQQDAVLHLRDRGLEPATFNIVSKIADDITLLEAQLVDDMTTLSKLRTLAGTSAQINSSLELDSVLNAAMERVIVLTGAERGYIVLVDETCDDGWQVRLAQDATAAEGTAPEFRGSRTILRDVLTTGTTLLTDNAYNDPAWGNNATIATLNLRSVLCVPLRLRDEVIGAVYVDNRVRAGIFTAQSQLLLTAFANQAAIAISNARLYTSVQDSITAITALRDLIDNIFNSIGSGVITTNADNRIIICNPAAQRLLGCPGPCPTDADILQILPPCDYDIAQEMAQVRASGDSSAGEARFDTPDGQRVFSFTISRLHHNNERGIALVLNDLTQQHENEEMLRVLRRYLSPEMVDNIHTIAALALGGERRETTCLFVDVRPITTFPPGLRPPQLMELLNQHLSVAAECIHQAGGIIDKYMGHEIMALFNSQLNPQPDHAARAVAAALAIRESFVRLYQSLGVTPAPHYYRVGIHSGVATLGNVGSEIRRDFTAIGDAINLSKRLEENASASQIIISEAIRQHIHARPGPLRLQELDLQERDPIKVKGRQQHTRVYEVFRIS